jgi:hypothetical protein
VGGRNIEQNDFVGAIFGVHPRELRRISGIAQIDKLHAFHHASGVAVEAGDDAFS